MNRPPRPGLTASLLFFLVIGATPSGAQPARDADYTEADVRFMQGMIHHHAQAVEMGSLVPPRTDLRELLLLAERIDVSQRDEIVMMRSWLIKRDQPAPDPLNDKEHGGHGEHGGHHPLMPGMLTPEEIARLPAASGAEFERLFLEFMIFHHEGALVMVADLLASPGAAGDSELFRFASDVDADQRAEIRRMRTMLNSN